MNHPYEPKNGDYALLIAELDKAALEELIREQQAAVAEHQRHSQQVPESFTSLQDIKEGKFSYAKAQALDRQNFKDTFALNEQRTASLSAHASQPAFLRNAPKTASASVRTDSKSGTESRRFNLRTFFTTLICIILSIIFCFAEELDSGLVFFLFAAIGIFLLALFNSRKSSK